MPQVKLSIHDDVEGFPDRKIALKCEQVNLKKKFRYVLFYLPRFCTCASCRLLTRYYLFPAFVDLLTILLPTRGLTRVDSRWTVFGGLCVASREGLGPSRLVSYPFSPLHAVLYTFPTTVYFLPKSLLLPPSTNRDGSQGLVLQDINLHPHQGFEMVPAELLVFRPLASVFA